ncbi:hypothetical protein SAMN06295912_11864 [Sphingomonas laterariae]|uniref:Uncharacterized protein n=1 Tax=Edaphosphingomonas laterariae TaxID=861865 RepID=A0A239HQ85_9SPHN|nr:hypothetical protein [Sphingomonas laterariae]SNS83507.1 hypothetical protein SAMN06295912_11864 [Sphingomonas laterariae]
MTIKTINLNKLLRLCALQEKGLISELRSDLRSERDKKLGIKGGGGHFHYPWWNAAKDHAIGKTDLELQTALLITLSKQRRRLYPLLTEGFLSWFRYLARTTNQPISWREEEVHTHYVVPGLDLTVKVDNLLALKLGGDRHKLIYPYFSEHPALDEKWARMGLWLMAEALSEHDLVDMELLDILRGHSFSGASHFLKGDEEAIFESRYSKILDTWDSLKHEYGL